ncbi:MAG: MipA/OmpV family protein [Rhodospirillales bacterium]|nr:MipA/OmpV family protein [Rhodospirillales bacterium]
MRKAAFLGTVLAGGILAAGPALAKEPGDEEGGFGGFVMAGAGFSSDYDGSDDYEFMPMALLHLSWDGYYANIAGPSVKINVVPFNNFDFGPTLSYGGGRDDDVEDDKVKLLREVDDSLEIGFFAEYRIANPADPRYEISVGLEAAKDVNDGHDGTLVTASLGYQRPVFGSFVWSLGTSASYADDDYMNAYFDIDANNASRSGLARFDAEGGIKDVGLSTSLSYRFGESWNVAGRVSYTRLIGDAADSPVVDDRGSADQLFGGITIGYGF